MNTRIPSLPLKLIAMSLVTLSCIGTSCTSLQQTTVATTDDLYYTPNNTNTIAEVNNNRKNEQIEGDNQAEYQDYQSYPDDRFLRLKVANRNRWDAIDDFGYWNDPRFNIGWNNWYNGFYGSSWFNPFGINMGWGGLGWGGMGWGGLGWGGLGWGGWGWGFDDIAWGGLGWGGLGWGGLGWGGWGWGGLGWGGMGWGGMGWGGWGGWGGWNPYFGGFWNPYGAYYYGGGFVGGIPTRRIHFQDPRATQTSTPGINAYRNPSSSRGFNNTTNITNGNTRYTGNANLNNNFGSLLKRVVTNNANTNYANSWDRPARYFNNNGGNTVNKTNSSGSNNNNNSNYSSGNIGGRSGGFNSSGSSSGSSGRAPRPR